MRTMYLPMLLAILLSACGGGDRSQASPEPVPAPGPLPAPAPAPGPALEPAPVEPIPTLQFGAQIAFGDSLSDVGTYAVGEVKALGGGTFTINGDGTQRYPALTGKNWTEVIAARLGLPAPCAAQTGLNGVSTQGFSVAVQNHAGCFGYAQGGARVTQLVGPNHIMTGSPLGALTVPVTAQISDHLARSGGSFEADDLVLVMAGGNDVLTQLATLNAASAAAGTKVGATEFSRSLSDMLAAGASVPAEAVQAISAAMAAESTQPRSAQADLVRVAIAAAVNAGNLAVSDPAVSGPMVQRANAAATLAANAAAAQYGVEHGPSLVTALALAGSELALLVKNQLLAKGARQVVVNNLPDVAKTPAGLAASAPVQALMVAMAQAFNAQLADALSGEAGVTLVDVHALSQDAAANPGAYGLSNVTDPACDLTAASNPLSTSLLCNVSNLRAGDVSRYAYADSVHPTPYFYQLLADEVAKRMALKGWM